MLSLVTMTGLRLMGSWMTLIQTFRDFNERGKDLWHSWQHVIILYAIQSELSFWPSIMEKGDALLLGVDIIKDIYS